MVYENQLKLKREFSTDVVVGLEQNDERNVSYFWIANDIFYLVRPYFVLSWGGISYLGFSIRLHGFCKTTCPVWHYVLSNVSESSLDSFRENANCSRSERKLILANGNTCVITNCVQKVLWSPFRACLIYLKVVVWKTMMNNVYNSQVIWLPYLTNFMVFILKLNGDEYNKVVVYF